MFQEQPEPFSRRHGFRSADPPITIWDDAPEDFRHAVLSTAHDKCGMKPYPLRDIVCGVLRKRPDPSNWSEYPNVWGEAEWHVYNCDWYRVYDIIEAIRAELLAEGNQFPDETRCTVAIFDREINAALRELVAQRGFR